MKLKKFLPFIFIIIFLLAAYFLFFSPSELVSVEQQQLIDLWGNPAQFVITYLPQDAKDGKNLVRYEVWYYPQQGKQVDFLGGKTLAVRDFSVEELSFTTQYLPWDFDFDVSLQQIKALVNNDELQLVELPGFSDEGVETYANKQLILVFEDDYLTYVQTLAFDKNLEENDIQSSDRELSNEISPTPEKISPTISQETNNESDKKYTSSDLGFAVNYPAEWFLQNGVLTNYDTNYLNEGGVLPEEIIKCDFVEYDPNRVVLDELKLLYEDKIQIYQTKVMEDEQDDTPGYGDNVVFLIEDDSHQPMALLCFAYEEKLGNELQNMLKTFEFID